MRMIQTSLTSICTYRQQSAKTAREGAMVCKVLITGKLRPFNPAQNKSGTCNITRLTTVGEGVQCLQVVQAMYRYVNLHGRQ